MEVSFNEDRNLFSFNTHFIIYSNIEIPNIISDVNKLGCNLGGIM